MKRPLSGLLLCLASFALPAQGAAAGDVCGWMEAIGLSMPERHAAIKIEAEARIGPVNPSGGMQVRCLTDAARTLPEVGLSARHDAPPSGDVPELPVRHQDAAADSVMQLQELPPAVMQYQRHAQPLAVAAFTRHLNPRDERC